MKTVIVRNQKNQISSDVADYWNYRDEMSVIHGIIFKGGEKPTAKHAVEIACGTQGNGEVQGSST